MTDNSSFYGGVILGSLIIWGGGHNPPNCESTKSLDLLNMDFYIGDFYFGLLAFLVSKANLFVFLFYKVHVAFNQTRDVMP